MQTQSARVLAFPSPVSRGQSEAEEALIGTSEAIQRVRAQIHRVAPYFRAALLAGEPGSGIDAVARALHAHSPARALPLITLDTAAAEKFASTVSHAMPHEGTLLLPEVDRLSMVAQHHFLRRLRQRSHPIRIIAATQVDLRACVSAGHFSLDFADALSAIRIQLPPLRERTKDVVALTIAIAKRMAASSQSPEPNFAESFLAAALAHKWPGNLPELETLLKSLSEISHHTPLTACHFEDALSRISAATVTKQNAQVRMMRLEDIVQEHIRGVLMACHGNKLRAAEVLGISRSTLYRMLDSYTPVQLPLAS